MFGFQCGFLEQNSGLLEEQQVILTDESSFQLPIEHCLRVNQVMKHCMLFDTIYVTKRKMASVYVGGKLKKI